MAYQKTDWEDFPSTNTSINAQKLNKMENGIANAVERTGDILTGELQFNNKNDYGAVRKTRTINGVDYSLSLGVGANQSARLEIYSEGTTLGQLDIKNDGSIYNGKTGNRLIETKSEINYGDWHSVVLTRSDNNNLYVMLYGSNHLKEGNYSIANNFKLVTYGSTNSELTIPKSALNTIYRRDWGFELVFNRSGISGIASGQYNGVAVPYDGTLVLRSS